MFCVQLVVPVRQILAERDQVSFGINGAGTSTRPGIRQARDI